MKPQPPKWADRFLAWYCHPDLLEDLQGDLYEIFQQKQQEGQTTKAKYLYIWLVLRSFRLSALKENQKLKNSFFTMTRNNLKIAIRVLWRDKFNSAINLLGLTLGITCFLLLGLYVKQEVSYDHFHSKKDRIYRSWLKEDYGDGREFFNSHTPLRFELLFEDNFPEVERSVQYIANNFLVGRDENRIDEEIALISPDFLEVFDFQLINGDKSTFLPSRDHIAISSSYAKKYFGMENPMGKTLPVTVDSLTRDLVVSAVFEDLPIESGIRFDMAISTENCRRIYGERLFTAWFNIIPETYVLLKEGTNISSIENKMQDVVMSLMGDATYGDQEMQRDQYNIGFQPLTDIHLNPDVPLGNVPVGNPQYVMILGAIGLLVLIMACVNYTTLSAGQSLKRSKEVGMRKVLGASKRTLIYQYLSESLVLAIVAMSIGTVITFFLIPTFNALTGTEIFFQFEWWHIGVYLALGLIIGFVAGSYPAIIITAFKTIHIINGSNQSTGKLAARKGLVVLQFLVTVFLISTVLIMQKQVDFLMDKNLGYDYKAVISAQLPVDQNGRGILHAITSGMENGQLIKSQLKKHPQVSKIAIGNHLFGSNGWTHVAFNDDKGDFKWFRLLVVNPEYLSAFNIKPVQGRDFEIGNGLDQRQSILINKSAAKYFGLENPIGDKLPGAEFGEHQIIGVVDDFHYSSLHSEVEPLVIVQNILPIFKGVTDADIKDSYVPKIVFTYSGTYLHDAIEILEKEWKATFSDEAPNFEFIDDRISRQYESEARLKKLIVIATVLSILIAGLGLFGLIMLVSNSKIKEIGIRKVMGASPLSIFRLLIKGFVFQLLLAILLSIPLTLYLINQWLENFAYRIDIPSMPFILSGLATFAIAAVVVAYHAIKASSVNPIESLRVE
ncbi:putative ABC transport system permease protein [Reichenbachiella faecimaris]|uniref:Putative ABC transport system permease protein n=1 Tax=Reichenbachiella faecimaris TaxID=692418 RepID=A0A1W2G9I4_REIFA|nr:ABC transporter permease [Reichenbachiella faecimaris]SMD32956.1 putative ABC transport system permease protein [Reichenbachiella faecimaris]